MRPRTGLRAVVLVSVLAGGLLPTASLAQDAFRPACDLIGAEQISEIIGLTVTLDRSGPRHSCNWLADDPRYPGGHGLTDENTLDLWRTDASADITVGGLSAMTVPDERTAAVYVALADGGTLRVSSDTLGGSPDDAVRRATAVAEAILAGGPVSGTPPARPPVEPIRAPGAMCELVTADEVGAIAGATYMSEGSGDDCAFATVDYADIIRLGLEGYRYETEVGTYAAEELSVAGRFARWEPDYLNLDIDAGDDRLLRVSFGTFGRDAVASRDQAIAIAELLVPRMATGAAPPPQPSAECAMLTVEELGALTGLTLTQSMAMGEGLCGYMTADMQSGVLVGRIPGESPQAVMESAGGQPPETQAIEVAGRPALAATVETPPGAGILMDLDGLPGGDGQVLYAYVSGAPAGVDPLAVARQVMELVLARM